MLKLENSIRGLSFSRVAFDLTIQGTYIGSLEIKNASVKFYVRVFVRFSSVLANEMVFIF